VLAIIDRHRAEPLDAAIAEAMSKSAAKERILLAVMAGRVSVADDAAVRVGADIERRARATYRPRPTTSRRAEQPRLLDRIKAAIAA
jgi:predicted DCC family thiol-disulfide oxidoreductase YuxK